MKSKKGFGLIGLLITILIISILVAFIIPNFFREKEGGTINSKKPFEETKVAINTAGIQDLKTRIMSFQAQEGRLPSSLQELLEKGYIKEIPQDQFGGEISYSVSPEGESFTLTSAGQDKILGTGDDIRY